MGQTKPNAFKASKYDFGAVRQRCGKTIEVGKGNMYAGAIKTKGESFGQNEWRYSTMNSEAYSKRLQEIVKGLREKGKM